MECTTPPPRSRTAGTPTSSPQCSAVHGVVADPEHSRAVIGAQMWREEEMAQQYLLRCVLLRGGDGPAVPFMLCSRLSVWAMPATDHLCMPSSPAMAERLWSPLAGRSFQDRVSRLPSVRVNQTVRLLHRLLGAQGLLPVSPTPSQGSSASLFTSAEVFCRRLHGDKMGSASQQDNQRQA